MVKGPSSAASDLERTPQGTPVQVAHSFLSCLSLALSSGLWAYDYAALPGTGSLWSGL